MLRLLVHYLSLSKELSLEQAKIALETLKTNGASAAELKLKRINF